VADFSNFELGDNVYELADGLIPEIAEVFQVELGAEPNQDSLGELVGAVGKSAVLRENVGQVQEVLGTDNDAITIMADWIDRAGTQQALNRSLWTPDVRTPNSLNAIVLTGGMANWMDRTAHLLERRARDPRGQFDLPVVLAPVSARVMDSQTEQDSPNVQLFHEEEGRYPTEAEYMDEFVAPRLFLESYYVEIMPYDTTKGSEIAARFVADNREYVYFERSQIAFARVANAGVQLAVEYRRAIQNQYAAFDRNPVEPQTFILTDELPVARNAEQAEKPREYQRGESGLRQLVMTAKMIDLASR
jgi:hypothetical protein